MGWFGDLINKIKGSEAVDLVFVPGLAMPGATAATFQRDRCYVELYVDSLRLEKNRSFATKFHGLVYSFVTLSRAGDSNAQVAAVSKPEKIAELDKDSIGKVITVSKQMMGSVPWRGGNLQLELGLFAVKSGNLLTPVLDFVTRVSETAGISFVGAVKPFVPLITEGMDMIAGQTQDSKLQVGVDTAIALEGKPSMACAIIAEDKRKIDPSKLSVDGADRKLLYDGQPLVEAYCVFSLRLVERKADYGEIPEIKAAYATFRDAVIKGVQKDAEEALVIFRRTALFSPDLIPSDAKTLVGEAEALMKDAFGAGGIAKKADRDSLMPASLEGLSLYK